MAAEDGERACLKLRLAGSQERVSSFGHPYIRHLCSQVPEEWASLEQPEDTLLGEPDSPAPLPVSSGLVSSPPPPPSGLVRDIAVYCIQHSAESEACDMLMEIEHIGMMVELVSEDVHDRVCLYLTRSVAHDYHMTVA